MAQQGFQFVTDPAQVDLQQIARRRRVAEMLLGQSAEPLQTNRMAGGYVVPINPLEGLAKMAQAWASGKIERDADTQTRRIGDQMASDRAETFRRAMEVGQGTPIVNQDSATDALPGEPMQVPARPGNPRAMYEVLMNSRDPSLQQAGMAQLLKSMEPQKPIALGKDQRLVTPTGAEVVPMAPQRPNWQRVELPVGNGGVRVGFVDTNSPNPMATFTEAGAQGPKGEVAPSGVVYNPYTVPLGTTLNDPNKPVNIGPDGRPIVNETYVAAQERIGRARAPNQQTTVINAGPKAFETELGKADAEQLTEWRKAAQAAQSTLGTVANMRDAIKRGVYSGGTANLQTTAASFINGVTGYTPKGLVGSETFIAEASKLVLDHIKTLGANPSNADREFIEKTVPRITSSPEARDQLISYMEQKAQQAISRFQSADAYARQNRGLGGFQMFPQQQGGAAQPSPPRGGGGRVVVDY